MKCSVCFETEAIFDGPNRFLSRSNCRHTLCINCWKGLRDPVCPLCRENIKSWLCDKNYKTCNKLKSDAECKGECKKNMCSICYIRHITKCRDIFNYSVKHNDINDNIKEMIRSHSHLCDFFKLSFSV